jgi:hypothetical protein
MLQIAKLVRFWFGFHALLLVLTFPWMVFRVIRFREIDPANMDRFLLGSITLLPLMLGGAALSATAWWTLRKARPSAQFWAIIASLISLPLLGVGTAFGIAGLVVFSRKNMVAAVALRAEPPRLPGDGTSRAGDVVLLVAAGVVLLLSQIWWSRWSEGEGLPRIGGGLNGWLQFLLALHASVVFHELGHVLAGWASRMKLRGLVLGPFHWAFRSGKWEFRFKAAGLLGAGQAALVPMDLKDLAGRNVFTTLGGPVASLLSGCIGVLGAFAAKGSFWESWWYCFAMLATFGFLGFVANLMPGRPDGLYSDGARIYQFLSRGGWADVHMAFAMVTSSLVTPLRYRDMDATLIRRAARFLQHGREAFLLRLYLCLYHLDCGRVPEALEAFADAEALYPELAATFNSELCPECAFICALYRHDLPGAQLWWQRFEAGKSKRQGVDYWKGRTAILWLEGNVAEARQAWEKGNVIADNMPAAGAYDIDRWCFVQLREAMNAPIPASAPPSLVEIPIEEPVLVSQ